ncbi:hypothetical protein NDR87_06155 [Nocardia sp. CDC159]|uniref:DUF3987 domain-containing protein n=1 Tax=Nocardia pulmonis TaxID=2951408 RepID=A0A9X2E288_9NOCA|nr:MULTISPECIES: hypothetical protein [Nocardia]MCM6772757.1 hypothetical protein [Nocardia pulmonis]MCM6785940.1 hypothetical protein [Nocardia sp. CDC159]
MSASVDYGNAIVGADEQRGGDFWQARPVLTHIRDFSRSRMCGPWSTLGVVLARAVASVPPTVQLPATVGGSASLNLFVALVGPSGAGKGASESAAREAVVFTDHRGWEIEVAELPLGSGEGIARTFRPAGTDEDAPNPVDRMLFTVPEVDTLASLLGRQGSTLEGELRKLYSGEALGFTNAQKATRSVVAAQSYRAALTLGVQPLRAGTLFAGADGGTTQRFVWMDVRDPEAPDITPAQPDPITVRLPRWQSDFLVIPEAASSSIRRHRLAQLRDENVDPLNGHALLCRLKVAAALMILDGRSVVSDEDWTLAERVMRYSNHTRTAIRNALTEHTAQANRARGIAAVEREEAGADHRRGLARNTVLRVLSKHGPELSASDIRRRVKNTHRPYLDDAFADLTDTGDIHAIEVAGGTRYRLPDAA